MKKAIIAIVAILLIVFVAVTLTLAFDENRRSDETISRVDAKIQMAEGR